MIHQALPVELPPSPIPRDALDSHGSKGIGGANSGAKMWERVEFVLHALFYSYLSSN